MKCQDRSQATALAPRCSQKSARLTLAQASSSSSRASVVPEGVSASRWSGLGWAAQSPAGVTIIEHGANVHRSSRSNVLPASIRPSISAPVSGRNPGTAILY
jgi:hypothetical protein